MKYLILLTMLLAWFTENLFASSENLKETFERINTCIQGPKPHNCRTMVTSDSIPIYNRFVDYGLTRCLPKNISYSSQQNINGTIIIKATSSTKDTQNTVRLVFTEENNHWKFNIPASLKLGLGANWQDQLNVTEQTYLMVKGQMGMDLSCDMINGSLNQ